MENNKPSTQTPEQAEDIVSKARANKKSIIGLSIALIVIVVAILAYLLIAQQGSKKADEKIALADMEQNDSIAAKLYAEAATAGYKSGNRAKAEMGIRLFNEGKYEEALKYLDDANISDNIIAAGVCSLKGDCYVNLDKNDKALKCFDEAISKADHNPQLVPLFLVKKANVLHAEGKYADEAKAYKTILDEYPDYARASQTDIKKYYERAAAMAAK